MITHPEKVLFPEDGITKGDLAKYYETLAPVILPHLRGRPVTMERYPAGIGKEGFWQKDVSKGFPDWLQRIEVPKKDGVVHHPVITDARSLLWVTNQNTITQHVWTSRAPALDYPDICVFDLDPSREDPAEVRAAAIGLRDLLEELTLPSWIKTTGSKGFHIVVPLDGKTPMGQVARFADAVGTLFVSHAPDHLTQEFNKADRRGRIYVDTGRNGYSATFAAAYTVRAKRGAPVSAPCTWKEVERGEVTPDAFTLRDMAHRVAKLGDLWGDMTRRKRSLKRPMELLRRMRAATVLAIAISSFGCNAERPAASYQLPTTSYQLTERSRLSMGSALRLTAWTGDPTHAEAVFNEVFGEFDRLEKLMSTWIADSDISRINRAAGVGPVRVSPEVREVLRTARQISHTTRGKFDVTFGTLAGLWKFDHDQDNIVPDVGEVRRRLPFIDYRAVEIDDAAGAVFVRRKGMSIHLGGIGKGYAIDRGVDILRRRGIRDFMIQSGGDAYVGGLKDGQPWRLGIQDPRGAADRIYAEFDLSDGTFSTSGDYERFFIKNGRRYHHILDPATGEPAHGSRSVTIVTNRAVIADGLSTGVFIMGADAGMTLIEQLPDVEGVIVSSKNEVLISSGLRDKIRIVSPPTDAP